MASCQQTLHVASLGKSSVPSHLPHACLSHIHTHMTFDLPLVHNLDLMPQSYLVIQPSLPGQPMQWSCPSTSTSPPAPTMLATTPCPTPPQTLLHACMQGHTSELHSLLRFCRFVSRLGQPPSNWQMSGDWEFATLGSMALTLIVHLW